MLVAYRRDSIDPAALRGSEALWAAAGFAATAVLLIAYAINLWGMADRLSINGMGAYHPRHKEYSIIMRVVAAGFAVPLGGMAISAVRGFLTG